MIYLGKRKVTKRGSRGLSIMLPTIWCRANSVEHGMQVSLWADFDEGTIYIRKIEEVPKKAETPDGQE